MINPVELRKGSVIQFDDDSKDIVKVDFIFFESGSWFVQWDKISGEGGFESGNSLLEDFNGIRLNAEILHKCNWIWNAECNSFERIGYVSMNLRYRLIGGFYVMFNYVLGAKIADRIYDFHHLQNLVFDMTGEELQYQP